MLEKKFFCVKKYFNQLFPKNCFLEKFYRCSMANDSEITCRLFTTLLLILFNFFLLIFKFKLL
jgi:hypothetical protein